MVKMVLDKEKIDISYVSLDEAIKTLEDMRTKYPQGRLSIDSCEEYGSAYTEVYVEFQRPQTEEEIEYEQKRNDSFIRSRRAMYEQLKKEFEG